MTTGVQDRADPRWEVPAPSETGICKSHAKEAAKAGVAIPRLSLAGQVRLAWSFTPDKELEP
jgi:hypothetical protein